MTGLEETKPGAFDILYSRRSARVFEKGKKIPPEIKTKILQAACWAPASPLGEYPWRMLLISDESTKKLVAESAHEVARTVFGGSYAAFSEHLWYMPPPTRLRVAEYTTTGELWRYPEDCDMLVIPLVAKVDWGGGLAGILRRAEGSATYWGMAAENMWLTATAYGIGTGYNVMPLNDIRRREVVSTHLGIPQSWEPVGGLSFGYSPTLRLSGPSRPPIEGIAFTEYWGCNYERLAFRGGYEEIEIKQKNIFDSIENLNLVESFERGKVEDWMVEKIVDAAIWAPAPENFKHFRYLIIRDQASKEFLYKVVEEKRHAPYYFTDAEAQYARLGHIEKEKRLEELERIFERGIGQWYPQADVLIIPLAGIGWVDSVHLRYVTGGPPPIFHVATSCGVQNILIAATALGLGVNFDTHAIFDVSEELLRDFFGIPFTWSPLGVIGIGLPGKKQERRPPPPLQYLVHEEYWGNPYSGKT